MLIDLTLQFDNLIDGAEPKRAVAPRPTVTPPCGPLRLSPGLDDPTL